MLNQSGRILRALIEQRIGLAQTLQERVNLDSVLDDLSGGNLEGYTRLLQNAATGDPPWQQLIKALVIGETYFFRNRAHFDLLRNTILPDIRARQSHSLNIWSAGCATGEEPYSIAIALREALPDVSRWTIDLLGTDLNQYALQAAQRAVYRNWSFRHTEKDFQARYFSPADNSWRLLPLIADMVTFRQHNVIDPPPVTKLDVIFCCNVLLYFEKSQIYTVEDSLFDVLNPGGWLILGQAEALQFKRERWTTHIFPGAVVYQKPAGRMQLAYYHPAAPEARQRTAIPREASPAAGSSPALLQTTYGEAVQLMRLKNYAAAEQMLNAILMQMPDNGAAHVLLACLLANQGALPRAHEQLNRALQLDGLQADAHYLKGVLLLENAQNEAALESLRAAIYCRRGHPLAATILGHLYLQAGDQQRAERVWTEALNGLRDLAPETPVSDLSDLTAEGVSDFLSEQLKLLGT